jgi:hypothetical protein
MPAKPRNAIAVLALLAIVGIAIPALAQMPTPTGEGPTFSNLPSARPRIEVTPRPLQFRRCTSWYVVQYRPSGTVLFPEKHCWWVHG